MSQQLDPTTSSTGPDSVKNDAASADRSGKDVGNFATNQPGLNGKKVVIWTVGLMIVSGGVLAYTLWVYTELEQARLATAKSWRAVASQLDQRYSDMEFAVEYGDVSAPSDWMTEFTIESESFRTTTQTIPQIETALRLEELLTEREDAAATGDLSPLIDAYNKQQLAEVQILDSVGGKILDVFLKLPRPIRFSIE